MAPRKVTAISGTIRYEATGPSRERYLPRVPFDLLRLSACGASFQATASES